jgi:hypothetical protein
MKNYQEAAPNEDSSRYFATAAGEPRIMGGINFMMFGDMLQLPPIPSSSAVFVPPQGKPRPPSKTAEEILDLFWSEGEQALNFFMELIQQHRTSDIWYRQLLDECRLCFLADENYNFLMGLPTRHHGCWLPKALEGYALCKKTHCAELHNTWKPLAEQGADWATMLRVAPECDVCSQERLRRCRLVTKHPEEVKLSRFLHGQYVHQNNQPKYHVMLLRALEHAKRGADAPRQAFWVRAWDTPVKNSDIGRNAEEIDRKLLRYLQLHDQTTSGIPGLLLMYEGAPVRITEKIKLGGGKITVLKHSSGKIVGWELHSADSKATGEFQSVLKYLPKVVYVQFTGAIWQLQGLAVGVLPMFSKERTWILNKTTKTKLQRKGFTLVADFASTAFMTQGETLDALIADCGDLWDIVGLAEMLTCYVILSFRDVYWLCCLC